MYEALAYSYTLPADRNAVSNTTLALPLEVPVFGNPSLHSSGVWALKCAVSCHTVIYSLGGLPDSLVRCQCWILVMIFVVLAGIAVLIIRLLNLVCLLSKRLRL
jgi:hypothetical protein